MNLQNISSLFKEIKELNYNEIFKKRILKILFYIYYFEEYLSKNDLSKIFKNYELKYCLINSNWIQKYKEFYNYKEIQDFLKDNNFVNYSNSDGNYEIILNSYLDKYPNLIYSEFPENLINYKEIKPFIIEYEKLSFYGKNYIISEKIIEMIKKNVFQNKNLPYQLSKIFSLKGNIFLVDNSKLIIGNLNDEFLFIPKYILNYKYYIILENEKSYFNSCSIGEYIELSDCKEDIKEKQIMKNENSEEIGELIILNDESKLEDKNNNKNQESNKNIKKDELKKNINNDKSIYNKYKIKHNNSFTDHSYKNTINTLFNGVIRPP